jgi:predicted nucleic acid-binding protein
VIAYIDSSVLLRIVLGQTGRLPEWKRIERGITSGLTEVECLRTIDRMRLANALSDDETAQRRETVFRFLDEIDIVEVTPVVLHRASLPSPTPLGTLDALHLATAMLWREMHDDALVVATHDRALGLAARANGTAVVGL